LPEALVSKNEYAREFATRPEAISILLYDYEYNSNYFSVTYLLLTSQLFQDKMDPLERNKFLELSREKQNDEGFVLYGSPITIPI
jgi:hypothetical protein